MDDLEALRKEALQYEESALLEGIAKCRRNIAIFEEAIVKERETIERYQGMIQIIRLHREAMGRNNGG